jgi:hypothetical protein
MAERTREDWKDWKRTEVAPPLALIRERKPRA